MRKAFNEERVEKDAKDPLNIINDPTILAHVELGKTICMLHYMYSLTKSCSYSAQTTGDQ